MPSQDSGSSGWSAAVDPVSLPSPPWGPLRRVRQHDSLIARLAAACLEWTPGSRLHDLRHMHATLLVSACTPVNEAADRLGHAKPTVTLEVYAKLLTGNADKPGDSFGMLLEAAR